MVPGGAGSRRGGHDAQLRRRQSRRRRARPRRRPAPGGGVPGERAPCAGARGAPRLPQAQRPGRDATTGSAPADQLDLLAESVSYAATTSAASGATVLVEPLNLLDTPGYLLPTVDAALALIARIGKPNVKIQFDVFHVVRAGDDPLEAARRAAGHIGHVQIADVPGRHEPGSGELPFDAIFDTLRGVGYDGDIGLEYVPTDPEAPDFAYLAGLRETLAGSALRKPRSLRRGPS